jgi:hypothetical protein
LSCTPKRSFVEPSIRSRHSRPLFAVAPHRAGEHEIRAEVARDLSRIAAARIGCRRAHDLNRLKVREPRRERLRESVDHELAVLIAGQILKAKDGEVLFRYRHGSRRGRRRSTLHALAGEEHQAADEHRKADRGDDGNRHRTILRRRRRHLVEPALLGDDALAEQVQLAGEIARRGVTIVGRFLEQAGDDAGELRRRARALLVQRLGIGVEDRRQRVDRGLALEGGLAGHEFVENRAERELIGTEVDPPTGGLLRRHVAHRAEDGAGSRSGQIHLQRVLAGIGHRRHDLRQAEVENLHVPVAGDHDVLGLEIAMHDAALMRGGEAVGDLGGDVEDGAHRHRALLDDRSQIAPFDVLHDDEGRAVVGADLVDRHDVRMIERGGGTRLLREARQRVLLRGEPRREHLDRDFAPELRIACDKDFAHAARADRAEHFVVTKGLAKGSHADRVRYGAETSGFYWRGNARRTLFSGAYNRAGFVRGPACAAWRASSRHSS